MKDCLTQLQCVNLSKSVLENGTVVFGFICLELILMFLTESYKSHGLLLSHITKSCSKNILVTLLLSYKNKLSGCCNFFMYFSDNVNVTDENTIFNVL